MGTKWAMPLAVIGKPTGDGRRFRAGVLTHRELPLPLRYVHSDSGGHKEAVVVGRIDTIGDEKDGYLPGTGVFFDDEHWPDEVREAATTARMLIGEKVVGPSVDLDEQEMERVPEFAHGKAKAAKTAHAEANGSDCGCGTFDAQTPQVNEIVKGRVASATIVHIPAFAELAGHAVLTLETDQETEGGSGTEGAEFRQFDKGVGGGVDRDKLKESDFGDPGGRKFPIVTAQDVMDAAHLIGKAGDPEAVKRRIVAIARRKGFPIPESWKNVDNAMASGVMASLAAGAGPLAPPADWFEPPGLEGLTPLTITDDGRVFGHLAAWGTCHTGIGDRCITPPTSRTGYAYFHTGETVTAEGDRVAVGHLTFGAGHASPEKGYRAAAEHYDNTAHTGAVVRAGEDEYGIWVAGALVPDVDEQAVYTMRHTPLSGDWRRVGGNLEMVGALHVNVPGFPVPRLVTAGGEPQSLTAAGALIPTTGDSSRPAGMQDPDEWGRKAAEAFEKTRQEMDRQRRAMALVASMTVMFDAEDARERVRSRQRALAGIL